MVDVYNTTFIDTSTNVMQISTGVNTMSGGLYAALVLFVIFIIMFIAMKKYDTDAVFLTSSFVTSVVAVLFFIMEWIGVSILVIPIVLLIGALFYKVASK